MSHDTRTVALPQGTLPYLIAGEGAPLVVVHTSGGPLWTPLLDILATTRRVLMPVLPGYGLTPMLDGVTSVSDLADLVADFIRAMSADAPVDLFGGSFGGRVALYVAARRPELVAELLLEAPSGVAVGADPGAQDPDAARTGLFAHPGKARPFAPSAELAQGNSAAFKAYGGALLVDEALLPLLPDIRAATLVIMGTRDTVTPPETGRYLTNALANAKLTYVYDAAHAVQVDQPEAMARVSRHFLDKGSAFIVASREYA